MEFTLNESVTDGLNIPVITLSGEIDLHSYVKMMAAINRHIAVETTRVIIINIITVSYIDSTGLGAIAKCAHHMQKKSGQVAIICTKPQIINLFEICKLTDKNVTIFETEAQAVHSLRSSLHQ